MVFSLDRLSQETLCHTKYGGLEDFSTELAGPAQISGPLDQASLLSTNLHRQVVKFKIKFVGLNWEIITVKEIKCDVFFMWNCIKLKGCKAKLTVNKNLICVQDCTSFTII